MVDAAAIDALDALEACPCCLLGPQQRCLKTSYTHLDNTEIYSDMLRECFNIQLDVASDCGICEDCVLRIRDASHFKRQVQRSQVQLHERLTRALKIIEEAPPVTVKSETADEDGTSDNLSGCELADGPAGVAALEEPPVETADDTGTSEDFVDFEEPPVETADDTGTSEDFVDSSLNQSEMSRACSVSLEQMFVDTEHRTCTVGSQTYKLGLCSKSPRPTPEGKGNNTRNNKRSNLKNKMETAGEQKALVPRQVYSVTNEDVGDPGVKHSKTSNITEETTPYKCSHCSYASARKSELLRHESKHTGEKPYKCNRCSYASAIKSHLLRHVRVHTGEKPYKCSHCSYASADKSNLIGHETRKHIGQKPHKFSHRSYTNAQDSLSLVHEGKHTGDKRYKCSHCSYSCAQKCHLVVHVRLHTGEKPYKCNRCSYACADKSNLHVHQRKHTGEKPYKCRHCSYASAHKKVLQVHERNHTGEKPYKCSHCSYASISKSHSLIHERKHNVDTVLETIQSVDEAI